VSGPEQIIAAGGLVGGLAIWLRAAMLKPNARAWATAPSLVSLTLAGLGILMLMLSFSMVRARGRFSYEEAVGWLAVIVSAIAVAGLVLLINLWLQHRRRPADQVERRAPSDTL
jgi:protein-S-isoprenylcysteine O-methyltransferase Ste14